MSRARWSFLGLGWVAIGVLLTGCLAPSKVEIRRAKSLYRLGVDQSNRGELRPALVVLVQAKKLNPQSYWIHEALGGTFIKMKRPKLALKHFKKALALKPKSPRGWNNLGVAYMALLQWKQAVVAFHTALRNILYQTPCIAEMNLGWSYHKLKNPQKGLYYLLQSARHCPRMCQAYRLLGKVLLQQTQFRRAEDSFLRVSRMCSKYPEGYYLLARAQLGQKKYVPAIRSLRSCMKFSAKYPRAYKLCEGLFKKAQTHVAGYIP